MATVVPAAATYATIRLSNAVFTVLGVGIGLRPNPIKKACAGRPTANRNTTTSSMLPDQSEPPNRHQTHGNARAENDPANAAVTGVGVVFTLRDRVGLDGRESAGYSIESLDGMGSAKFRKGCKGNFGEQRLRA